MNGRILRLAALMLAMLLLCGTACAEDFYEKMPEALSAKQTTETSSVNGSLKLRRTYPKTSCAQVDAEIRALVDAMAEAAVLRAKAEGADQVDVGATISRSGTSSFGIILP